MHVHGFPNCFIMSNAQAGFTANYPHLLNEQAKHLAYIIRTGSTRARASIEVSAEAEQAWVDECIAEGAPDRRLLRELHARLLQQRGQAGRAQRSGRLLRRRLAEFFAILEAWRAEGTLPGMVITSDAARK